MGRLRRAGTALLLALALPIAAAEKLQLNRATEEQLVALGLTASQAVQVINYRKENLSIDKADIGRPFRTAKLVVVEVR